MVSINHRLSEYAASLPFMTSANSNPIKHIGFACLALYILAQVVGTVYSVYFGRLSGFPGPKLAAATEWWQIYTAFVEKEPLFRRKLWRLHKVYGPVIRIGPNELHFANPDAYAKVYLPKFDKEKKFYHPFGPLSIFGESTFVESKRRRDRISNFFSKRSICKSQFLVQEKVDRLVQRVFEESQSQGTVDMFLGFKSMAVEIMTSFLFGKHTNALEAPKFNAPLVDALEHATEAFGSLIFFPTARKLLAALPLDLAIRLAPKLEGFFDLQKMISQQIYEIFRNPALLESSSHETIFHYVIKDGTEESAFDEGLTLMIGGTETVGNTLTYCMYYLLQNTHMKERLVKELRDAWPDVNARPRLEEIEKLPYLTAVLKEGLRLAPNAPQGLKRVPPNDCEIDGYAVPAGTTVSQSILYVHRNEACFKDPEIYDPERWLSPESRALECRLIPFTRGPRSCVGINLAWCELYLTLANMMRRLDLELDGTVEEDLTEWAESITPFFYRRHLHIRAKPVLN